MTFPTWVILAGYAVPLAGYAAVRRYRRRRADRQWAAGIASRVHDREYLDWLEEQFASEERCIVNLTADLAIGAMFALAVVQTVLDHRFRMRVADRLRVVNPAKAQQQAQADAAGTVEELSKRRPA